MDIRTTDNLEHRDSSLRVDDADQEPRLLCAAGPPAFASDPRSSFLTRPDPDAAQVLQRSRTAAPQGSLLSPEASLGPYGDHFWAHVARGVPGRTAGECLDAYLADTCDSAPVARFSV